jgi:hypothetical protein
MPHIPIIAVLKVHQVLLVKHPDIETWMSVQRHHLRTCCQLMRLLYQPAYEKAMAHKMRQPWPHIEEMPYYPAWGRIK